MADVNDGQHPTMNWMEHMGAPKETLEELQQSGTDGSKLMFCMHIERQSNENIEMVEGQLKLAGNPLLCMRLRQRLTSEAFDTIKSVEWRHRPKRPGCNARLCACNTR